MKEPCAHELKPHCEYPTCKHCGEIWYDLVGYNRAIELAKKEAERLAAKEQV